MSIFVKGSGPEVRELSECGFRTVASESTLRDLWASGLSGRSPVPAGWGGQIYVGGVPVRQVDDRLFNELKASRAT